MSWRYASTGLCGARIVDLLWLVRAPWPWGWAGALFGFALMRSYPLAIAFLFLAGFCELSFSSMVQTLVQMNAPDATRGRVLGLYNMAAAGLRAFSGVTVGLLGSIASVHASLAVAAASFVSVAMLLFVRMRSA